MYLEVTHGDAYSKAEQPHLALQRGPLVQPAGQRIEQRGLAGAAGTCCGMEGTGHRQRHVTLWRLAM